MKGPPHARAPPPSAASSINPPANRFIDSLPAAGHPARGGCAVRPGGGPPLADDRARILGDDSPFVSNPCPIYSAAGLDELSSNPEEPAHVACPFPPRPPARRRRPV